MGFIEFDSRIPHPNESIRRVTCFANRAALLLGFLFPWWEMGRRKERGKDMERQYLIKNKIFASTTDGTLVHLVDRSVAINPLEVIMLQVSIYFEGDFMVKIEVLDPSDIRKKKTRLFTGIDIISISSIFLNAPSFKWNQHSYKDVNLSNLLKIERSGLKILSFKEKRVDPGVRIYNRKDPEND